MTFTELEQSVYTWASRLRLTDWIIKVTWLTSKADNSTKFANVSYCNVQHKEAVIAFNRRVVQKNKDLGTPPADMDMLIVHELLHLTWWEIEKEVKQFLSIFSNFVPTHSQDLLLDSLARIIETQVDFLAKSLVSLYRSNIIRNKHGSSGSKD